MTDKDRAEVASYMEEAKGALADLHTCIYEALGQNEHAKEEELAHMFIIAEQLELLEKMYIGGMKNEEY